MQYKAERKKLLVRNVFETVAKRYDIMNDVMSLCMHRLWKLKLLRQIKNKQNVFLLDIAGGTGDIAVAFVKDGGKKAVISDINEEMLREGQNKLIDNNDINLPLEWITADAENLPFASNTFDCCTISFGIRNVDDINKALREIFRVLKKDGTFLCLEFVNPESKISKNPILKKIYDLYSFDVIPKIGQIIVGDAAPYEYLVNSIRKFPKHEIFINMIKKAGFNRIKSSKMGCSMVALYKAKK